MTIVNNQSMDSISFVLLIGLFIMLLNFTFMAYTFAQSNDDNYTLKNIQHMMGHGPHHNMMMNNRMQLMESQQQQSYGGLSVNEAINTTDQDKIKHVSIVFGATSKTVDAYQPNPIYITQGQTVVWTNNDNTIHTVTKKSYFNQNQNIDVNAIVPSGTTTFNSGVLYMGQSFYQMFTQEGIYNYYCTIHPRMAGQVIVTPSDSNSTYTNTNATKNLTIESK